MFTNFSEYSPILYGYDQSIHQGSGQPPAAKRCCIETGCSQPSWAHSQIQSEPSLLRALLSAPATISPLQYQMVHPRPATVNRHGYSIHFNDFPHQMYPQFVNTHYQGFEPPLSFNPAFLPNGYAAPNGFTGFPTQIVPNQSYPVPTVIVPAVVEESKKRKASEISIPSMDFLAPSDSCPVKSLVVAKDVVDTEKPETQQIPTARDDSVSPMWSKRCLVLLALLNAKNNSGSISDVYKFLKTNFPYFEAKDRIKRPTLRRYLEDRNVYENRKNSTRAAIYRMIDVNAGRTEIQKQLRSPFDFTVGMRFPGMFNDLINGTLSTTEVMNLQPTINVRQKEVAAEPPKQNEPIVTEYDASKFTKHDYDVDMLCFPEEFFVEEVEQSFTGVETLMNFNDVTKFPEDQSKEDLIHPNHDDDDLNNFILAGTLDSYSKWLRREDSCEFRTFN